MAQCKNCNYVYNHNSTFSDKDAGYYKVTNAYFRLGPYQETNTVDVKLFPVLSMVQIAGSVKNAYGHIWYKTVNGYYIYSGNAVKIISAEPASTLAITAPKTSITITRGDPLPISGSVTSNYTINNITVFFDGKQIGTCNPKSSSVTIKDAIANSFINDSLLTVGTHTLKVTAMDTWKTEWSKSPVEKSISITVKNPTVQQCAKPTIAYTDIAGGKRVTIKQNTAGGTLYYNYYGTDGRDVSTTQAAVSFDINQSADVSAYAARSGMKNSARVSKEINVSQLDEPTFEVNTNGEGAKVVIKSGQAAALRYSRNGTDFQDYSAPLELSESGPVYAYAVRKGCLDSETALCQVNLVAPSSPVVSLTPANGKLAVNSAVMISWDKLDSALSYTVKLYKAGGTKEDGTKEDGTLVETREAVTETSAAFILSEAADYTITVCAQNRFGSSPESTSATVSAVAPLEVQFKDYDGKVLSKQMVNYGTAATAPQEPERRGHYFLRWDKDFSCVTEDMVVSPEYKVITYTITYLDADGRRLRTEDVDFGEPAHPPVDELVPPTANYKFLDWSISAEAADSACDLNAVDSNMTVQAVFQWKDKGLPVAINSVDAVWRSGNYYTVTVGLEASNELPSSKAAANEAPAGEDAAGDTPAGEDAAGEAPAGEDVASEAPAGEDAASEAPAGEDVASEAPAGEDAAGETPANEAAGETPASEAAGENPANEAASENPANEAAGENPANEAAGENPANEAAGVNTVDALAASAEPEGVITALVRVSLKTAEGKMVKTESRTVQLSSAGQATVDISLNYSGVATKAEAVVLGYDGDYLTGSTYAEAKTADVTVSADFGFGSWSDWSENQPADSDGTHARQTETKTQYRARKKETTTSTSSTLEGWESAGAPVKNYGTWGSESAWTKTQPTVSDTLEIVQKRTVTDKAAYTQYKYYHYWGVNSDDGQIWCSYGNAYWKNYESTTSTTAFPYYKTYDGKYKAYKKSVSGKHSSIWWLESTTAVPAVTHTEWTYRTRSAYDTYSFFRWGAWSDWTDTAISATDDTQVETKTLYRYRDQNMSKDNLGASEDKTGELYHLSGTLPVSEDLAGKLATVLVYKGKNSDPNESQLQYVGQTAIQTGNRYDISFKTREAPSVDSGDYMVALSLEGSTGLVTADIIKAPVPKYTVKFVSGIDNALISTAVVDEGSNVDMPEPPPVEGYRFVCWSDSGTNIHGDANTGEITITAQYVPNTYAVAFVDYTAENVMLFTGPYGASLKEMAQQVPTPTAEGYRFVRWDYDETAKVTGNTVIRAVYEPLRYTVEFSKYDGETLSSQQVAYGESAQLPNAPAIEGMTFLGWSTEDTWWNVTENLKVSPLYVYNETAMQPESDIQIQYTRVGATLTLTAEPNAKIYYTLDGSDPDITSEVYTGPITLAEDAVIRAISVVPRKNESDVLEVYFDQPADEGEGAVFPELVEVGTYSVIVGENAAAAENGTKIQVKTDADLGLIGYLFTIECDRSVFYLEYDETNGFAATQGDAAQDGMLFCSMYGDSGWQVLWFTDGNAAGAGDLFELPLKVFDGAEPGTYPVKVSYSPANTITKEDVEASTDSINVLLGGSTSLLGDVNGDGYVTTVDVVRIARYIIDDFTLTKKQLALADVTGDGEVNAADVIRLARYIVGLAELG